MKQVIVMALSAASLFALPTVAEARHRHHYRSYS
jgi:hypothetical protein